MTWEHVHEERLLTRVDAVVERDGAATCTNVAREVAAHVDECGELSRQLRDAVAPDQGRRLTAAGNATA